MNPTTDLVIAGSIFCLLVVEIVRRTGGGRPLVLVCSFFALYPTFAGHMPGLLQGGQFTLRQVVGFHALSSSSLVGLPAAVFGTLIIGYLVFGVVLVACGGAKAFMDFALALFGTRVGGPAKVSIVASGLFGTISGSIMSNVITTGSVTIPAMRKTGYPDYFAGAVETVASTGGALMPPVMGAVAFLMAAMLDIPYIAVCVAAIIPALLYYLGLYLQVHAYAVVHGLRGLEPPDVPPLKQSLVRIWPYFFSLFILVLFIALRMEARAPFLASAILILVAMVKRETRLQLKDWPNLVLEAAKILSVLLGLLVGIGYVIGSVALTGVGASFAHEVGALAGGNIPLLIFLGAVACVFFGMGLSITAIYIFLVIIVGPPLVAAGLNPLAIHLFVIYFGLSSNLTPPVALGAYTAAGVAGSNPMKTAFQAMRLGILIYILPFSFLISPALVLQAPLAESVVPLATVVLGAILLAAALEGYLIKFGTFPNYYRLPFGISGLLLLYSGWVTDIVGIVLFALTISVCLLRRERDKPQRE
jgi:TRAP transporter 4TM/12TM fusion protein